jgi:hypothetical protein
MKLSKIFRKATNFFLVISIAVSCISCTASNESETTTSISDLTEETTVSTEKGDALDARKNISDNLPQKDYGGRDFTILTDDYQKKDIWVESENGEVVNDAVFRRNQTVSERFNININEIDYGYQATTSFIQKVVLAGDNEYQLAVTHVVSTSGLVMQDLFVNWYDVPNIDFTKPWWAKSNIEDLTYKNEKAILVVGDLALSAIYKTYCYFYDKTAAESYGIGNVYDIVRNGDWTLDKVSELTKNVYKDLNGNGERDEEDYYGMTQELKSGLNAYLWSCDNPVLKLNKDGVPELVFRNNRTNDVFEKLYSFLYESEGVCTKRKLMEGDTDGHFIARDSFANGLTLFANGYFDMAYTHFRFNQSDYGIIPYPKLNAEQKEYKTMAGGSHAVLSIPKTVEDLEFVGIITEALNAESYKKVIPAYYDVALKVKLTRDEESVEMLDMIMDSRVFDFGYVYDNWKGMSFYPERLLGTNKSKDFESYFASNSSSAIEHYNKVIEFFENMK